VTLRRSLVGASAALTIAGAERSPVEARTIAVIERVDGQQVSAHAGKAVFGRRTEGRRRTRGCDVFRYDFRSRRSDACPG
jgi:hypothetical protein